MRSKTKLGRALQLLFVPLSFSKIVTGELETCETPYTQSGFQLQGHIIKRISTMSKLTCMDECKLHNKCYSINYHNGNGKCELNAANHLTNPESLSFSHGFYYISIDKIYSSPICSINFCSRKTDTCLIESNMRGYKCLSCKDSGGQQIMTFPQASTKNKAVLEHPFDSLNAFTLCSWVKPASKDRQGVFSYATAGSTNEILVQLERASTTTFLSIYLRHATYTGQATYPMDTNWHHICLTWENTQGKWEIYIDGNMKSEGTKNAGRVIGKGAVILGQDQDSYKGNLDSRQSYQGNLTNVNLWDKVLKSQEVADVSQSCSVGKGNVLKWSDFIGKEEGDMQVLCSSACVT